MSVGGRAGALLASLLCAILWLLLVPTEALAWGPATHVAIGEAVLASLHLLPPTIRSLLERHRLSFLYGSVAADISFAKKYAAAGRHSHHWHIGQEILESSDSEALRAVGMGYLSHLAADTIAHNFFVPRLLLLTSTSQSVGHAYWEHRMDVHLGKRFGGEARRIVLFHDHSEADELFDRVLSRTLFSFQTNRRIFRGMIAFQDDERWQQIFEKILNRSRFDLPVEMRDRYVRLSYDFVMDFLAEGDKARALSLDPIGEQNLKLAKVARREARLEGYVRDPESLEELADQYFALPSGPLLYLPRAPGIEVPGLGRSGTDTDGQPLIA
ncbi:MAG: hypothetical protein EXR92_05085 [Gemmatimonadetes bacterium]|nr:hypothetical protein [Gemmatimonadota bacterium]